MSDKENQDDGVEIPEAAPEDFASKQARGGLSPAAKFGIVIGGVFAVIGGAMFIGGQEIQDPTSSIRTNNADLDATPGGAVQSESPRYQELLEQNNDEQSEQASREGRTFIPTPERILRPIDDLEAGERVSEPEPVEPAPEPAPEPTPAPRVVKAPTPPPAPAPTVAPAPTRASGGEAQEEENPYTDMMIGQMGSIAGAREVSGGLRLTQVERDAEGDEARAAAEAEAMAAAEAASAAADAPETLIPAGDIIYAETLTSTNSDLAGSPVLVELTTGEYRGARLIGGFQVNDASDKMVIQFSTMTLPDGTSYEVSGYAVDGFTAEAAVASDVERRYLQRYGPILASAFITSYAEAMSEPEQTLASVGDDTAVVQQRRDEEQSLYAGLGAAAGAIGSDLTANAPKGPKIILRDGWPLAVMFTDTVTAGQ